MWPERWREGGIGKKEVGRKTNTKSTEKEGERVGGNFCWGGGGLREERRRMKRGKDRRRERI